MHIVRREQPEADVMVLEVGAVVASVLAERKTEGKSGWYLTVPCRWNSCWHEPGSAGTP